jgi:hypothetical protein
VAAHRAKPPKTEPAAPYDPGDEDWMPSGSTTVFE